jgi:hypothetical protein
MAGLKMRPCSALVPGLGLAMFLLAACGGESAPGCRPSERDAPGVLPSYGSGPVFCDVTEPYELTILDDFELGAARGSWYTNNDVCSRCQEITDEIERLRLLIDFELARQTDLEESLGEVEEVPPGSGSDADVTDREQLAALKTEVADLEETLAGRLSEAEREELENLLAYRESEVRELEWSMEIERIEAGLGQVQVTATHNLDPTKGIAAPTGSLDSCLAKCEEVQAPSFFTRPIPAERIENGRCGSAFALRVQAGHPATGAEPLNLWGGVMGFQFSPPLDASEYEGVAFWGRVGVQSRDTYRVQLTERHTDETFRGGDGIYAEDGSLVPAGEGSFCNPATPLDDTRSGCDKFGSYVINGSDWKFFRLPFSEMRQSGWGRPAPFFDVNGILSIVFAYEVGSWDIWIDDVALYKRR